MTSGWFEPTAISKTAMDRLLIAGDSGGLSQECKLFQLSHDTALAILFWMYDIDYVEIDHGQSNLQWKTQVSPNSCHQDTASHYFNNNGNWSRTIVYHAVKTSRCMQNLHNYLQ